MSNSYNWSHRKLTFEEAEEMRAIYARENTSHKALAWKFGVSTTVARFILNGKTYKKPVPQNHRTVGV